MGERSSREARAAVLSPATAGGQAAELRRLARCLPLGVGSGTHPPDARFLIPRLAFTFKWYAGRGEVVNWKETPQDAASLVAWWKRIQDIYATGKQPPQDPYYTSLAGRWGPEAAGTRQEVRCRLSRDPNLRLDFAAAGSVSECVVCRLQVEVRVAGCQISNLKSQVSNLKSQISSLKSQVSSLTPMLAVTFDMDGLMFNTEDVYTLAGTELLARRGCLFTPRTQRCHDGSAAPGGIRGHDRLAPSA